MTWEPKQAAVTLTTNCVGVAILSDIGKKIRLGRIFDKDTGKTVVIAMDHAIGHGVIPGIDSIGESMAKVIEGQPNAITLTKGIVERCFRDYAGRTEVGLLVKITSFAPYHPAHDAFLGSVEEAVSLGADGVSMGITLCGADQIELLETAGRVSKTCRKYGMPLIAHSYPKGELIKEEDRFKAENVSYAARAAAEVGVDLVKTFYTGSPETFRKVVMSCPTPVVIAGGPKTETPKEALEMTKGAMEAGAAGVTFGRNVWGYKDPTAMVRAIKKIVHEGASVEEALRLL